MSPIALLYILLASPIFSENIYSRRHLNEELLPVSHYSKNIDRLFRESPIDSIFSTSTPSWIRRSNVFGRRSIVSELYPESEMFDSESTFEPLMRHVSARNIEVIRRLAETHPEMINVVIEKLLRPESRVWAEDLIRNVNPESLVFGHKLIRKNLPVYLREKIVRRLVKSVLPWTASTRRSLLSEVSPIESTLFSEPRMTKFLVEKLIRRSVEKKLVKKVLRMIKKSHAVEDMLLHSTAISPISMFKSSTEKRIIKKIVKREVRKAVRKTVRKIVKNVLRNKRSTGFSPMPWSNNFCSMCTKTCMYTWTPMCTMCDSMCNTTPSWNTESWNTPSYFSKKHNEKKIIKKLIKKLSTEELYF